MNQQSFPPTAKVHFTSIYGIQEAELYSDLLQGFLDNPKPCVAWPEVRISVVFLRQNMGGGGTRPWHIQLYSSVCGVAGWCDPLRPMSDVWRNFLRFGGVDGTAAPTLSPNVPGAIVTYTTPKDVELGESNFQNTDQSNAPNGSSPAVSTSPQLVTGATFAYEGRFRDWSMHTSVEYSVEYPEGGGFVCIPYPPRTGGLWNNQPIDSSAIPDGYTEWIVAPCLLHEWLTELPEVSVQLPGQPVRQYKIHSSAAIFNGSYELRYRVKPKGE